MSNKTIPEYLPEEVQRVLRSNAANTYTMSCALSREDLYERMRNNIKTMCEYVEKREKELAESQKKLLNLISSGTSGDELPFP